MVTTFFSLFLVFYNATITVNSFQHTTSVVHKSIIAPKIAYALQMSSSESMEIEVVIPPQAKRLLAQIKCEPVLDGPSELIEVRYGLPFGLDVAPKDQMVVCNKAGANGERPGDVLRYTSQWTMGLPRGDGILTTAASFSGGLSWQCSLFDVMKASRWEDVIEALTSNTDTRTDEVVLIFERKIEE